MFFRRPILVLLPVVLWLQTTAICHTAAHISAASDFHNDSGYSGKQILRMGLERFLNVYTHGRRHWQEEEKAYPIYVHYKAEDNKRRIANLKHSRRRQMKRLYTEPGNWESEAVCLRYDYYSHGTALRGIAFRRPAQYEEFAGYLLDQVTHSTRRPAPVRRSVTQAAMSAERLLRYYQQLVSSEVEHPDDFRSTLKEF